jgi:uncharacterized protein (DUF2147 family)
LRRRANIGRRINRAALARNNAGNDQGKRMRKIAGGIAALLSLGLASGTAQAQKAEDAFGTWRHPENGSHVQMYACGGNLCAKIVKIMDGQKTDDKNPNEAKRSRPIIGLHIMTAKKTGDNTWAGTLYNRMDGKTYSGTITVTSKNSLDLAGCSMGVFCKSATWSRIN